MRWKGECNLLKIDMVMEEVSYENTNLGIETSKVEQAKNNHRREVDRSTRRQNDVNNELEHQKRVYENMTVALTKRN